MGNEGARFHASCWRKERCIAHAPGERFPWYVSALEPPSIMLSIRGQPMSLPRPLVRLIYAPGFLLALPFLMGDWCLRRTGLLPHRSFFGSNLTPLEQTDIALMRTACEHGVVCVTPDGQLLIGEDGSQGPQLHQPGLKALNKLLSKELSRWPSPRVIGLEQENWQVQIQTGQDQAITFRAEPYVEEDD